MWQSSADNPTMGGNVQYHIRCGDGDVNRYVFLPGDPERVDVIAGKWDESRFIASNREFRTFSGQVGGVPVTACSTGIGGPSTAIAFEELARLGADTFIRIGTCGAIHESVRCGDIVITSGAMRQDGTSHDYIDASYPALAHHEVILALIQACENLGLTYHVGVSCTTSSFHLGQARPGLNDYTQSRLRHKFHDIRNAGIMNFEMESATILTLAGLYGLRAGAVCLAVADRNNNTFEYERSDSVVMAAVEAVKILAQWDNMKSTRHKKFFYPELMKGE